MDNDPSDLIDIDFDHTRKYNEIETAQQEAVFNAISEYQFLVTNIAWLKYQIEHRAEVLEWPKPADIKAQLVEMCDEEIAKMKIAIPKRKAEIEKYGLSIKIDGFENVADLTSTPSA